MTTETLEARPVYEGDFWADEVVLDPYPHYRALREAGPVVWMAQHEAWVITRHAEVRAALADAATFSSARGCMMNAPMNATATGNILCTDDPEHAQMRKVFARPLMPGAVGVLQARMEELASEQIGALVERGQFEAVREVGHHLPISVVAELVGLPEEGRRHMLDWAAGTFDAFGPLSSPRTLTGMEIAKEATVYTRGIDPTVLAPDSWGAALFAAAERGAIAEQQARQMMMGYVAPALDTTINATSSAIWLFAQNPGEWDRLRADRSLMGSALNEVVRLESPLRGFSRYVTRDCDFGGVRLSAGDRALVLYASANRDERAYPEPERFDIGRANRDHVAFGYGVHTCAGMHLAKLEMTVILNALADRVARFEIVEAERRPHNTLRGLHRLEVRVTPG